MILTGDASDEFDRTRCKFSAVQSEALLTCENFRWSSMIHILAIANIMVTPVFSIYPFSTQRIPSSVSQTYKTFKTTPGSRKA